MVEGEIFQTLRRKNGGLNEKNYSRIISQKTASLMACSCRVGALLGKQGIQEVARLNIQKAHYACEVLSSINGVTPYVTGAFFNEFALTIDSTMSLDVLEERMLEHAIIPGLKLKQFFPELTNCLLVCVTEKKSMDELQAYIDLVRK